MINSIPDVGPFLINALDTPANLDFAAEMTSALRMVDGALILVDAFSGVGEQTQKALRRTLTERVKPILFLNKIDRIVLDKISDKENAFILLRDMIRAFNDGVSVHRDPELGDVQVQPEKGTVVFGSGLHGWAFTLCQFARRYSKKFGVKKEKMLTRLWGDHLFDPTKKRWTVSNIGEDGQQLQRGFTHFILDPIYKLFDAVMSFDNASIQHILEKLDIILEPDENLLEGSALLKVVMHTFLSAADSLLETIVLNLPSPLLLSEIAPIFYMMDQLPMSLL